MALNLEGFITPEQDFGGIYRAGEKLERRAYRDAQMKEQKAAKRAATGKFLADYLNPKDHLTGTNYDPMIVKGFNELLGEAASLADKGADGNTILMAITPKVNELSQYSTKAKLVNQRLKDQLSKIKPGMGYDIPKLEEEARRMAFYGADGKFKDISQVDPDMDWVSEVVKNNPEKVTNDAAIDEFVKNSPKFTNTVDVTTYDKAGGMNKKKVKLTAPNWLTQDTDERGAMSGLVPKYQVALEDGQPQMHEFVDEKGKKATAPVRLLDQQEFTSLMRSNPGIADWVRGQIKLANPNIDLNSPQAMNAARAILYSELKRRMPGSMEDVEVQNKPSSYQIKNYLGIPQTGTKKGGGGEAGETTGNAFDDMGDAEFKNFRIKDGAFYNADGTPKTGKVFISGEYIPSSIKTALNSGGIKPEFLIKGVDAEVKDGVIQTISNKLIGTVTRQAMEGVYQPKVDTEPLKGKKLQFADKNAPEKQKTYSLGGKQYSYSAVEAAAKKSGMSVEAYIKKAGLK